MTLDQIDRMVRQANPVPDPAALNPVGASELGLCGWHDHDPTEIDDAYFDDRVDGRDGRRIEVALVDTEPRPVQPDRRRRWPIVATAAAAVMGIVAGGLVLAARDDAGEVQVPAAPGTTVAPRPPSSATTTSPPSSTGPWAAFPPAGSLAAGDHRLVWVEHYGNVSLRLPTSGWISDGRSTITRSDTVLRFRPEPPRGVYADPCANVQGPAVASTADLAAAVAAIPGTDLVSGPSDITVGENSAYPAKHVVITVRADAPCGPDDAGFMLWYMNGAQPRSATRLGDTIAVWIIEADGHRYWVEAETPAGADPEVQQEINQIVQEIDVNLPTHRAGLFPVAGPLAEGEHDWPLYPTMPTPVFHFTVSAPGWRSGGRKDVPGGGGWIEKGTPGTPDGAVITFWRPDRVYADPCGHTLLDPQPSSSDLPRAVAAIPGTELVSGPTAIGSERFDAQQVVFTISEDIECDPQEFYLWAAGEHPRPATAPGSTFTVSIIDGTFEPIRAGPPIFVEAETYKGASPELQREVQQIIDSFRREGGIG